MEQSHKWGFKLFLSPLQNQDNEYVVRLIGSKTVDLHV